MELGEWEKRRKKGRKEREKQKKDVLSYAIDVSTGRLQKTFSFGLITADGILQLFDRLVFRHWKKGEKGERRRRRERKTSKCPPLKHLETSVLAA